MENAWYAGPLDSVTRLSARKLDVKVAAPTAAAAALKNGGEMAAEVPDDVVRVFAAGGTYDEIAREIAGRFGGLADAIEVNFPAGTPAGLQREVLTDIRRIPHFFEGFETRW